MSEWSKARLESDSGPNLRLDLSAQAGG